MTMKHTQKHVEKKKRFPSTYFRMVWNSALVNSGRCRNDKHIELTTNH